MFVLVFLPHLVFWILLVMTAKLPPFIIIGAQKCGTRWLRHNLGLHPDIFVADKEIMFFNKNRNFNSGIEWYLAQFSGYKNELVVGESTPGYMFYREDPAMIAKRILTTLGPDTRILVQLRDPVARARSAYLHHLHAGRIGIDIDPVVYFQSINPTDNDRCGLISGGWYGKSLMPYFERFGTGVHIEFQSDISTDACAIYDRVLSHLGVDSGFYPKDISKVHKSNRPKMKREIGDHPIFSLSDDILRNIIGHFFDADEKILQGYLDRPLPWGETLPPKRAPTT